MLRVVVADDQTLVRSGFRLMLEQQPDLEVVGEAADGVDAVELARRERPDVVLMDVRMPRLDGLEATRQVLARPDPPRVLVLTTFDLDDYVVAALRAGASGYLLKDVDPADLVRAVRDVAAGEMPLARAVLDRVVASYVDRPSADPDPRLARLSERETQVLGLIALGLNNAEIAARLVVSLTTVKTHVASVLAKLDVRDRVQAAILAQREGVVGSDPGPSSR